MDDVLGGMSSDNPLAVVCDSDEDTNTVVVPDFFHRVRRVICRPDGSARLLVWLAPYGYVVCLSIMICFNIVFWHEDESHMKQIMTMIFPFAALFPCMFPKELYRAIRLAPPGDGDMPAGSLALLGAEKKMVSASSLAAVRRWSVGLMSLGTAVGVLMGTAPIKRTR
eukprot:COSAG01_NODE_14071_length_1499_cov_7.859286_1_plen_167_part_00